MIERVWRSLKYEEVYLKGYRDKSMREAAQGCQYFDFYNTNRLHQSHCYSTPYQVYTGERGRKENLQ